MWASCATIPLPLPTPCLPLLHPALPDLDWLDLSRNALTALPPALAGATALALLELEGNPLVLSAADAALLAALPALVRVQLDRERYSDAATDLLVQQRPGLFVSEAPERRVPPESEGEGGEGWSSGDEELDEEL